MDEQRRAQERRRRKERETDAKMRILWGVLCVLVVILIAAVVYEVVLGHGMQETGSQRMESEQETETGTGDVTGREADEQETDGIAAAGAEEPETDAGAEEPETDAGADTDTDEEAGGADSTAAQDSAPGTTDAAALDQEGTLAGAGD